MILALLLTACSDKPPDGFVVVISGRVVDEADAGIGATVTLGTLDGEVVAIAQSDAGGDWSTAFYGDELLGNELLALYDAPGYTQGQARYMLNLRSPTMNALDPGPWQTWQASERRLPTMQLAGEAEEGEADVRITTLLGERVPGATIELRRGWNADSAAAVQQQVVADDVGEITLRAVPGWWTARVLPGDGVGEARFGVFFSPSGSIATTTGVVPSLDPVWLTAALTWAPHPLDLDLHLAAPLKGGQAGEDGSGTYHLWEGDPRHPENTTADAEAQMLRTDDNGEGPESLVVVNRPEQGESRLSALDNDNVSDVTSTQLGHGRAQLQVWLAGQEPAYYTVSPGEIATLWRPVEIEDDVSYEVETYDLGVQANDADAF